MSFYDSFIQYMHAYMYMVFIIPLANVLVRINAVWFFFYVNRRQPGGNGGIEANEKASNNATQSTKPTEKILPIL